MNEGGKSASPPEGSPAIDLDEAFWEALERPDSPGSDGIVIHLRVRPSTVEYFDTTGDDLSQMVRVLDAYAAAMTKKAAE